jgi:putative DNA primase/helicase
MVALGSLIGRKLGIRLKQCDDWTEYANIWGAIIGPPSALKSPAMRDALRPLKALQAAADEEYREAVTEYETDAERCKNELPRRKQRGIDSRKEQSFAPQAAGNSTQGDSKERKAKGRR